MNMSVFTMVAIIVVACVIGDVLRKKYESKSDEANDERFAEMEERLAKMEGLRERIEVLERIVTDRKENLKREFDYLDKAS